MDNAERLAEAERRERNSYQAARSRKQIAITMVVVLIVGGVVKALEIMGKGEIPIPGGGLVLWGGCAAYLWYCGVQHDKEMSEHAAEVARLKGASADPGATGR